MAGFADQLPGSAPTRESASQRADRLPEPIFVGGTGRSGTHAVGHLLGRHSRYHLIPREVVFHCAPRGIPAFLNGELDHGQLVSALRGRWWKRPTPWDSTIMRGLYKTVGEETFSRAVTAFSEDRRMDRVASSRLLLQGLLGPVAAHAGKRDWVEMSPSTVLAVSHLASIFPGARFVHVVRNGLDVACSLVRLPWGPRSVAEGLHLWADRLARADAAARGRGGGRVLVVNLEDLVMLDREQTYRRLLSFLGLPDEAAVRSFFTSEITPQRAHVGRWSTELSGAERDEAETLYEKLLADLRADGLDCLPGSLPSLRVPGPSAAEQPNPFDPWSDGRAVDA